MAQRQPYLPTRESLLLLWLLNFVAKLQEHRVLFGFSTAQVDLLAATVGVYEWIVNATTQITKDRKQFNAYKKLIRFGPKDRPMDELPEMHVPPPPGGVIPISGMLGLVGDYATTIKRNANYNESLGHDMGIIGPEDPFDPDLYKTNITVKVFDTFREINFIKGRAEEMAAYAREAGTTAWTLIKTGTRSPLKDDRAAVQPVVMEYMVKGLINNEEIGLPSKIVQVTYSTAVTE